MFKKLHSKVDSHRADRNYRNLMKSSGLAFPPPTTQEYHKNAAAEKQTLIRLKNWENCFKFQSSAEILNILSPSKFPLPNN